MTKQPSLFWHMVKWGLLSGTVLSVLFITFIYGLFDDFNSLIVLLNPAIWFLTFFFSGFVGGFLGAIEATIIQAHIQALPRPFTKVAMLNHRFGIYGRAFIVPLVAHLLISLTIMILGDTEWGFFYGFIIGIPIIIASIASVYAVHRYLFRLRLYDMQNSDVIGKRKHKAKNDALVNLLDDERDDEEGVFLSDDEIGKHDKL